MESRTIYFQSNQSTVDAAITAALARVATSGTSQKDSTSPDRRAAVDWSIDDAYDLATTVYSTNYTTTTASLDEPLLAQTGDNWTLAVGVTNGTSASATMVLDAGPDNYWALMALGLVFGTAAGNILVCLAICWERRLQNVTNYFLMSLAITDLMVAILVMPLGILTLVKGLINYTFTHPHKTLHVR